MKAEAQALLHKARQSLQAAELLNREGYLDFAVARGYYAMFYAAEALLFERGLSFSSHSGVIAAFGREFAKAGTLDPKFHRYLIDAQDLRHVGDYGVAPQVTTDQVQEVLCWTQEFLSVAERYLGLSTRPAS